MWKLTILEERRKFLVNSGILQQKQKPQTFHKQKKNANSIS